MKLVVLAVVAGVSGVAAADPLLVSALAPEPSDAYVALGLTLGIDGAGGYLDPKVDLGRRIGQAWWAHGFVTAGGNGGVDERTMAGSRYEAGAGIEARGCILDASACAFAGTDVAVRHAYYQGEFDMYDGTSPMLVEHAGIEVGGHKVHLRLTTSARQTGRRDNGPIGGLAVETGLAYQF